MNKTDLNMLKDYLETYVSPLLVEDIPSDFFGDSVIIKGDIDSNDLTGHYEENEYCPPSWYSELIEKSGEDAEVLVIENINKESVDKQKMFVEILKYRKVSTFELPSDCVIVVSCSGLEENPLCEEVYSLVVHI